MHEMLHYAAGARAPVVMVNVNRTLASPWGFWADQTDSLAQRDTGWIQLYWSQQEASTRSAPTGRESCCSPRWWSSRRCTCPTRSAGEVPTRSGARFLPPFEPAETGSRARGAGTPRAARCANRLAMQGDGQALEAVEEAGRPRGAAGHAYGASIPTARRRRLAWWRPAGSPGRREAVTACARPARALAPLWPFDGAGATSRRRVGVDRNCSSAVEESLPGSARGLRGRRAHARSSNDCRTGA
jgi:hypothetical protein